MKRFGQILLCGFGALLAVAAAKPPPDIRILHSNADVDYPVDITFSLEAESDTDIQVVELEFGLTGRDCTPDVNIVTPEDFQPADRVEAEWLWEVATTGVLPPGMRLWWRWHLADAAGNEIRTETQWITWIDDIHDWKTLQSENIFLYWYRGTEDYNRQFLKAAEDARELLRNDIGAWPALDIHIYIYGSNYEMLEALVGAPNWIGGLSFGQNQRTIIIGIDFGNEDWGKAAISHELAHTAVDSIMGGCWASIPLWLNEGIAMYTEGEQDEEFLAVLEDAIYYDSLFSLRSITYEYLYVDGDVTLTYAESYSVVNYMIEEYGHIRIRRLLDKLGAGYTYDNALIDALGVDMDGLEEGWRKAIGADPMTRPPAPASPTPAPDSTLPPSVSLLVVSTLTPTPIATATATPAGFGRALEDPGMLAAFFAAGLLCASGLGIIGLILFLIKRRKAASAAEKNQ